LKGAYAAAEIRSVITSTILWNPEKELKGKMERRLGHQLVNCLQVESGEGIERPLLVW